MAFKSTVYSCFKYYLYCLSTRNLMVFLEKRKAAAEIPAIRIHSEFAM